MSISKNGVCCNLEKDEVKAAARGRWREIISTLAGIPAELLDGKHHECPKCGGKDRFRAFDDFAETGGVLCNQCFDHKNGDGLATIEHFAGWNFPTTLANIADYLGLRRKPTQLPLTEVLPHLAKSKGVTVESLLAYGADARGHRVYFPTFDVSGERQLDFWINSSSRKQKEQKGVFVSGKNSGKGAGFFAPVKDGKPRLPQPGETLLICEGVKDPSAAHSLNFFAIGMPGKSLNKKFAPMLKGVNVILVLHRDVPGQDGAEVTGATALAGGAATIRIAHLPGEIQPDHGADLRDCLALPNGEALARAAIANAVEWVPRPKEEELPKVPLPGSATTIIKAAGDLGKLMGDSGRFYSRGGIPMRTFPKDGGIHLSPLHPAAACSDFETVAMIGTMKAVENIPVFMPEICSEATARQIVKSEAFRSALPKITVLSPCPVILERDGQLVVITGYDRVSGISAAGDVPEQMDLEEARKHFNTLVRDFDFASDSDRSRALAAIITPALVFGGLLGGRAPIDAGEADKSQCGKGYRHKLTAAIYRNKPKTVTEQSGGVGSMVEKFDAALVAGNCFISLDNLKKKLENASIESFMTELAYFARIPYSAPVEIDPTRTIVMLTSNKAELGDDMANRSSVTRIRKRDAGYEWQKFAEGDLLAHAVANQRKYLGAVFAVIREWHKQGKQQLQAPAHDFAQWAKILGWIVENLLHAAPLMGGHREVLDRISSPAGNWLRDLAMAVKAAGRLGHHLRANQLLNIVVEAGIATVGIEPNIVLEDSATFKKATRAIGSLMTRCVPGDTANADGITITRHTGKDGEGRETKEYSFMASPENRNDASPFVPTPPQLPGTLPASKCRIPQGPEGGRELSQLRDSNDASYTDATSIRVYGVVPGVPGISFDDSVSPYAATTPQVSIIGGGGVPGIDKVPGNYSTDDEVLF